MTGPGDMGQPPDSGWDAHWVDSVGRHWLAEFKTQFGDRRLNLVQQWVQTVGPDVFADLSWEQIAELRHNIAEVLEYYVRPKGTASGTYGWAGTASGETTSERLAATVESTSPKLAADLQRWSPQDIIAILTLLVTLIGTMFQIYGVLHPVTPTQVTQIINIVNNIQQTIVNLPPVPAGDGEGSPDVP